jgi:fucose 4-O-acetylase-like acetyltransferase
MGVNSLAVSSAVSHTWPTAAVRWPAIDTLKAVGIIIVPMIHTFNALGLPPTPARKVFALVTLFAVPGFFFAAGFLANRPGVSWTFAQLKSRLLRIVLPYLVASLFGLVFYQRSGVLTLRLGDVLFTLATGSAVGIYYFVPMLLGIIALTPLLPRHVGGAALVWSCFALLGWLAYVGYLRPASWFWAFRNPLQWWGFYLAGWTIAAALREKPALVKKNLRRAGFVICAVIALTDVVCAQFVKPAWVSFTLGTLRYSYIYAAIGMTALCPLSTNPPRFFLWLSGATYPIYLYHIFFVEFFRRTWGLGDVFRQAEAFVFSLAASVLLVGLARKVLGERARTWIG